MITTVHVIGECPGFCVGCLNCTASNMFRFIYGKSHDRFFEEARLQIAMMWAVKRRSAKSAIAASGSKDRGAAKPAHYARTPGSSF